MYKVGMELFCIEEIDYIFSISKRRVYTITNITDGVITLNTGVALNIVGATWAVPNVKDHFRIVLRRERGGIVCLNERKQ